MHEANEPHTVIPSRMRPMSLSLSALLFGAPALLFLLLQRVVVPFLDQLGVPPLVNFLVLGSPHVLFFFGALAAYRMEGNDWRWSALAARFRLTSLGAKGWLWAIAAAALNVSLYMFVYVGLRPILLWLFSLFPDPVVIAQIYGDATTFVGFPLHGNAWLLAVYLLFYFFNIMGEELWWRGYIFPRQELTHGAHTWLVHGLLWTGFHLFTPYNALMVLPGALAVSWIVQKQRNTWIFVIAHGVLNGLSLMRIVSGILG